MKITQIIIILIVAGIIASCAGDPDIDPMNGENIGEESAANPDPTLNQIDDKLADDNPTDNEVEQMTGSNAESNPIAHIETNHGTIRVRLFMDTMPITAGNFKKLVEEGFYDGVIFHRVIPNFMIQGGDPTGTGMGDPGYKIKDEFTDNNRNKRGTLSMANAGPNTGGSQFFINLVDNSYLDGKHPVFGEVIEGMDVVDEISKVDRDAHDKPQEPVTMTKVTIE